MIVAVKRNKNFKLLKIGAVVVVLLIAIAIFYNKYQTKQEEIRFLLLSFDSLKVLKGRHGIFSRFKMAYFVGTMLEVF